ncbi:MAG: 1,4-dihydroxy-6-naphthoate synthase [Spirochaetota bacterium]|nr:1,4-dihydroxy-6-naphthoate synthase [Spirochaetota bacterium]
MLSKKIDTAFSSCPNDTFIFHAMVNNLIDTRDYSFRPYIHDVEYLNNKAFDCVYEITKLSFHAFLLLRDRYSILNSGAALGFGCGPLLVAREKIDNIESMKVAIPGRYTTANLLLKLWNSSINNIVVTRFDNIIEGVQHGTYDAGLIIHEGRFVYPQYNLIKIVDLGEWWEQETGLPIPLGCIAVKRMNDNEILKDIEEIMRLSVEYALENRDASKDFIKHHAQELDDEVIDEHIRLYVNSFTIDLGKDGERAVNTLEEMAKKRGII